jgi:hypothetical protein
MSANNVSTVLRRRALRIALALLTTSPFLGASAQVVAGGDFDICDYCGTVSANTIRLVGRAGFGTEQGVFTLINGNTDGADVDRDGYGTVDFTNLYLSAIDDFKNVADPDIVIEGRNLVLQSFLNPLFNGANNNVVITVTVPEGTPAGTYRGSFTISDSLPANRPAPNANGELLRSDILFVVIEVLPNRGIGLVQPDTAAKLDSLVLRGRPGQTVSGVVRVANLGNVNLANARIEATDLIATSGTGLRIRSDRISFSPTTLATIGRGDTSRIVVTVRIPLGILQGSYRGELIVQADDVDPIRVPITVIVTTPGDIVFENNPVFGRNGDRGVIIFNADPNTTWELRIFDMQAITTHAASGTVFAGGTVGGTVIPGDQAVRYTWNLENGRGESVAAGMYLVVIEATQSGDRRQLRGKLMVIR